MERAPAWNAISACYLTRIERSILEQRGDSIAGLVSGDAVCVVDLGAGSGDKARVLLQRLRARGADVCYAPVDVSAAALWQAGPAARLGAMHPPRAAALCSALLYVLRLGLGEPEAPSLRPGLFETRSASTSSNRLARTAAESGFCPVTKFRSSTI